MKSVSSSHIKASYSFLSVCCVTFLVSFSSSQVFAAATGQGDLVTGGCMQDIAGFELGCTANDVRVSGVADITDDGIVDENDLASCLRDGIIAGAGVDVLTEEPPPQDHPLLAPGIPNLLVTPHNAWASRTARQSLVDQLAIVIRAFERGQPINRVI